jgi:hypothetical protein
MTEAEKLIRDVTWTQVRRIHKHRELINELREKLKHAEMTEKMERQVHLRLQEAKLEGMIEQYKDWLA